MSVYKIIWAVLCFGVLPLQASNSDRGHRRTPSQLDPSFLEGFEFYEEVEDKTKEYLRLLCDELQKVENAERILTQINELIKQHPERKSFYETYRSFILDCRRGASDDEMLLLYGAVIGRNPEWLMDVLPGEASKDLVNLCSTLCSSNHE